MLSFPVQNSQALSGLLCICTSCCQSTPKCDFPVMSERSRKHRKRKTLKSPQSLQSTSVLQSSIIEKRPSGLTMLGLILGAVGLLLTAAEFQARPTVSLESPLDPTNVLTTPIVISNEGLLSITDVNVATYIIEADYKDQGIEIGSLGVRYAPPNQRLEPGERETAPFQQMVFSAQSPMISGDVALIVSFMPQYMPFIHRIRPFRFRTVKQADGNLRFEQQPPQDVVRQYERQLKILQKRILQESPESPSTHKEITK